MVPDAATKSSSPADPFGFAAVYRRLNNASRRSGGRPAAILTHLLDDGEIVHHAIVGRFRGEDAIAALTDRRLMLVNAREWHPEVVEVASLAGATVEGWVERRVATVRITAGGDAHVIDRIGDTDEAAGFTAAVRERAG